MISSRKLRQRKLANDTIEVLADLWPYAFSIAGPRQPLKHGIHLDILAAAKGAITSSELKVGLRFYCGSVSYLRSCINGAARVDLNGEAVGKVTSDEAAYASEKLAPTKPPLLSQPPQPSSIKRVSLRDLRTAARVRKAGAAL
jgi:ProP effector